MWTAGDPDPAPADFEHVTFVCKCKRRFPSVNMVKLAERVEEARRASRRSVTL
jgi:hypothetical protein